MRSFVCLLLAVCLLAPLACGRPFSVQEDWDPRYSFSGLDAYAWLPIHSAPGIGRYPLERLVAAIDAEMAEKQLVLTADEPDVLLELHVMSEPLMDLNQYQSTSVWKNRNDGTGDMPKGSVMVDVLDAQTRELVWRAVANEKVDASSTPEEQTERYTKLVKQLLENFPPPEM